MVKLFLYTFSRYCYDKLRQIRGIPQISPHNSSIRLIYLRNNNCFIINTNICLQATTAV